MASIDFEGKPVRLENGDTVASALFRHGVRTFSRSLKYHRRRGLYCLTGDCPNCLCNVDGEPGVRACTTPAADGMKVKRETGWPSTERDLLAIADKIGHRFMPVGFYYKIFTRPKATWGLAEKLIRRATGVGKLRLDRNPRLKPSRTVHVDVLVIGGGVAGLSAALAAGAGARSVLLIDEGTIGERIPPGPTLDRISSLQERLKSGTGVTVLERHSAVGIYDGGSVPVVGPKELLLVEPRHIVVATGAVESHAVFPGNDLPGVMLGRGAARLTGLHHVPPGNRAVVATGTQEGLEHAETLRSAGVEVVLVLTDPDLASSAETVSGSVVAAEGRKHVTAAVIETPAGRRRIRCDVLVLSLGLSPRDGLLRMATVESVAGAGDVVAPGCTPAEAAASGEAAALGSTPDEREPQVVPMGSGGYVCLCEDVAVGDLEAAWGEGWRSSEIIKRYTTATMGPCQGAMCGRHLAAFAAEHGPTSRSSTRTTARPPARSVRMEDLAGAVHEVIEKRTALHERHLSLGARVDWSGSWKRPYNYGDPAEEYRAVRERVSLMDVGTLGKFLIGGHDAKALVDRVFPCRIEDLASGRSRYMLSLDEAGYIMDDGLICALGDGRYYLTSTSGGADRMEALLRDWADRWRLSTRVVNQTPMLGAVNVAGPRARNLLSKLCDDDIGSDAFPYSSHREITVAGVRCRAMRVGFVGELSYELHHSRSAGPGLWDSLLEAGREFGLQPHGLDALDLLRMEKGHMYLLQDTLPDDHPSKLGLDWAVDMGKPNFVGKMALERMADIPLERRMVGLRFERKPQRGVPLYDGSRVVGRVTSCGHSPALDGCVGLGWIRSTDGVFPETMRASDVPARVAPTPFYDPEGVRLRA